MLHFLEMAMQMAHLVLSPAFRDLKNSGVELMKLIGSSEGHSNKELNKMRRDIEAIIAKYSSGEDVNG